MAQSILSEFGRYEARRLIGDGAMGRVFEGWDPVLSRRVAVKAVKSEQLDPRTAADYLRRFGREAQAAGGLSHPSIVKVFDVGPDYLVMEYVEGPTLKELLGLRGRFAPGDAVRLLLPIADALDHAHRAGVVHRDVKPANIIVQPDGAPKLMDFGIAWVASSLVTGEGEVLGSPCYMSPEQILGGEVAGEADVWALAVVAYEMLTGRPPFVGTVTQVIYSVAHLDPPGPCSFNPALPARYDVVFGRAFHRDGRRRYPRAAELLEALAPRRGEHGTAAAASATNAGAWQALEDTLAWTRRLGWHADVSTVGGARRAPAPQRAPRTPTATLLIAACFAALAVVTGVLAGPRLARWTLGPAEGLDVEAARPPAAMPTGGSLVATATSLQATAAPTRLGAELAAGVFGPSPPAIEPGETAAGSSPAAIVPRPALPVAAAPRRVVVGITPLFPTFDDGSENGPLDDLDPELTPPRRVAGRTVMPEPAAGLPLDGTVGIALLIDENGVPTDLQVIESAGLTLDRAALASVRSWRFEPARRNGVPVRVRWVARQSYRLTP